MDIIRRETADPDNLGIPLDRPERREVGRFFRQTDPFVVPHGGTFLIFSSRKELEALWLEVDARDYRFVEFMLGEYRRGLPLYYQLATEAEEPRSTPKSGH